MQARFDPVQFCANIEKYRITVSLVVPPVLVVLARHEGVFRDMFKSAICELIYTFESGGQVWFKYFDVAMLWRSACRCRFSDSSENHCRLNHTLLVWPCTCHLQKVRERLRSKRKMASHFDIIQGRLIWGIPYRYSTDNIFIVMLRIRFNGNITDYTSSARSRLPA